MLASVIIRHLLEDPQTLQTAMELEIQQTLSGSRHAAPLYSLEPYKHQWHRSSLEILWFS